MTILATALIIIASIATIPFALAVLIRWAVLKQAGEEGGH